MEQKLVYGILKKVLEMPEMSGNGRIGYHEFVNILIKAMNLRKTKKHISQIFDIFDVAKTGVIDSRDLAHLSKLVG